MESFLGDFDSGGDLFVVNDFEESEFLLCLWAMDVFYSTGVRSLGSAFASRITFNRFKSAEATRNLQATGT